MARSFSSLQVEIYTLLAEGRDTSVDELFSLTGSSSRGSIRKRHQVVGPYITRLNRKLALRYPTEVIRSGEGKYTYRLTVSSI
jgi:hypothetical protein